MTRTDPARLPCPTCSGTGTDTHEDRHTETNRDTCRTCGGTGRIAARTGESPEASFGFVNRNTTATTGKDFPKMGMSFPGLGNGARTALTEAGQKVFDVLVKARAVPPSWIYWPGHADALNTAAALLFPAGEEAGLREALARGLYKLEPFPSQQDHCVPMDWDDLPSWAKDRNRNRADALIAGPLAALASPQPAVEGPVAAGVGEVIYGEPGTPKEIAPLSWLRSMLDACDTQEAVQSLGGDDPDAWGEMCGEVRAMVLALDRLATPTPPADSRPTVPGDDAGMRDEIENAIRSETYTQSPDVFEVRGIEEAATAVLALLPSLAPQTGSAGEDPKTPDAGVGEIWHREGATVYTLKEHEGPRRRGEPTMVNDHSFLVQGPDAEAVAARIHAALSAAPAARLGDGFVLVPREPTEEMQAAGWIDKEDVSPKEIYRAMLAAAPAADGGRS